MGLGMFVPEPATTMSRPPPAEAAAATIASTSSSVAGRRATVSHGPAGVEDRLGHRLQLLGVGTGQGDVRAGAASA